MNNEQNYFNDAPIVTPAEDKFGVDSFAKALARGIINLESPIGTTVSLNGVWGSGKSSVVNLIRHHLKKEAEPDTLEIIDFKCWWFRGQDALTLAFLQELSSALAKGIGNKAKEIIPALGKKLLQAGPLMGATANLATGVILDGLVTSSFDFAKTFFSDGDRVETLFEQLAAALENQNRRFLVVIDDVDRLTPDEALLIFKLVKSVGRLPNVIYLLAFDRELAEKTITERYPSEGPHFLEKIIQASFEVPPPDRDDLNAAALSEIDRICCVSRDSDQIVRFMNIFHDAIAPHVKTPRDIVRLSNALTVSWPAVSKEVNTADYVALETMRLFEPALYGAVLANKDRVCGVRRDYGPREDPDEEIKKLLEQVTEQNRENAKLTLTRLFPRFRNTSYQSDFVDKWETQRLVCTEKHFETYFRLTLGDQTLSITEIEEFIKNCGDEEYVRRAFKKALASIRKNGKSKVPLLFDEVTAHAAKIEKPKFLPLISAIFEIADEIDRGEDEAKGFSIGNTQLRIHWLIRRLTFERCSLEERSEIFMAACQNAAMGWLVDFTISALHDYFPDEGKEPQPPSDCLVMKEPLTELKGLALRRIEAAAEDGTLIHQRLLAYIMFSWRQISDDDGTAVKEWAENRMDDDVFVACLAKAFTGESWSQGMGELGDRVSVRRTRAQVDSLNQVLDVDKFRKRVEELVQLGTLEVPHKENVEIFLEAWRKRDRSKDRESSDKSSDGALN